MRPYVSYILPIRHEGPTDELTEYLTSIAGACELIVVDGSAPLAFARAHRAWSGLGRHVAPDRRHRCTNGKVSGVLTGLELANADVVVIADDDVRYTESALREAFDAIEDVELVWPQNYFDPMPWHARWDTARTLLNRAVGDDFPGTLVVRREMLERTGGYDGDVMFENLELIRTVGAAGGTVVSAPGLYVRRIPPTTRHFVGQRVRQAYDEFARPHRLLGQLAILPFLVVGRRRPAWIAGAALAGVATAEYGRRRADGASVFPWTASLLAPLWLVERGVCAWAALYHRARGGIPYGEGRIRSASTPLRTLRRRHVAAGRSVRPPIECSVTVASS